MHIHVCIGAGSTCDSNTDQRQWPTRRVLDLGSTSGSAGDLKASLGNEGFRTMSSTSNEDSSLGDENLVSS